jgi:hypothetical protein
MAVSSKTQGIPHGSAGAGNAGRAFPAARRWGCVAGCLGTALVVIGLTSAMVHGDELPRASPLAEHIEFFERKIRPVLVDKCYACHSAQAKHLQAELRLDSRPGLLRGGVSGPAVVPGNPAASLLLRAIRHEGDVHMPPEEKLPNEVVADFERWIKLGLPDPRTGESTPAIAAPRGEDHWAFQPPRLPPIPETRHATWARNELDLLIAARLEARGLSPSPEADRRTLVRRWYHDLIGLPPTYEEVEALASDPSPQADVRLVDRLLASPHFGERWARHWLDVARFADTKGYVFREDRNYPEAYKYRDWVIAAFNADMPYDEFLVRQLAADQLSDGQDPSALAAMGYLTLGRRFLNNKHDIIDDRIDVVMRGMQGLTVACARCHDHKYDPISIRDYYALYGVFASSREVKDAPSPLALLDEPQPRNARVFVRGNPQNPGDEVPRRFLAVLCNGAPQPFTQGSGRLELARAIASRDNPLTARVFVNRVWGHLFGHGLVRTPSDFGLRSQGPAQPEALDYLAVTFMERGWSLKQLLRTIVLSSTYRQSSALRAEALAADPDNTLVWRMNRRRRDLESFRDALLSAAGCLDTTIGGPSVAMLSEPFTTRRTLYGFIDRQNLPGLFRTFDLASPDTHAPQRYQTTVPQQALYLLNAPFVHEMARALAARTAAQRDAAQRVALLYRHALGRDPTPEETAWCLELLPAAGTDDGAAEAPRPDWLYGYGTLDLRSQQVVAFHELPHWTGDTWRGGEKLPDATLGWALLNARGGHPDRAPDRSVIRRWIAPRSGTLTIRGTLKHARPEGDGVQGFVVSSCGGILGQWTAHHQDIRTDVGDIAIDPGETIDFVVASGDNINHDSFEWVVELTLPGQGRQAWNSQADFHGPLPRRLTTWERLAHVLLCTNELAFVD